MMNPGKKSIPISPAVKTGPLLFIGGTPPNDESGELVAPGDTERQTRAVIERMSRVLHEAGMDLRNLVFVTIYLTDIAAQYEIVNRVYAEMIPSPFPARKVVQTPLAVSGMVVEMTAVASSEPTQIIALPS